MNTPSRLDALAVLAASLCLIVLMLVLHEIVAPGTLLIILNNLGHPGIRENFSSTSSAVGLVLRSGITAIAMAALACIALFHPSRTRPMGMGILTLAVVTMVAVLLSCAPRALAGELHWLSFVLYLALPVTSVIAAQRMVATPPGEDSLTIGSEPGRRGAGDNADAVGRYGQSALGADQQREAKEMNSVTGRDGAPSAIHRYHQGYHVAGWLVSLGSLLRALGWVLAGIWGLLAAVGFGASGGMFGGGKTIGAISVTAGLVCWSTFFIWGTIVSANGQMLQASLDSAVNTSPFLTTEEKAKSMSL